jgi:hypothetical protein
MPDSTAIIDETHRRLSPRSKNILDDTVAAYSIRIIAVI